MAFIHDNVIGEIPSIELTLVGGAYAAPATPGAGQTQLYFRTDDLPYFKTSAGVETLIASAASAIFKDSIFRVTGSADASKQVALEVDGLTTATTRTWTSQDASGTVAYVSATGQGYVMVAPIADANNLIVAATATVRPLAIKTSDNDTTKKLLEFLSSADAVLLSVDALGHVLGSGGVITSNAGTTTGYSFSDTYQPATPDTTSTRQGFSTFVTGSGASDVFNLVGMRATAQYTGTGKPTGTISGFNANASVSSGASAGTLAALVGGNYSIQNSNATTTVTSGIGIAINAPTNAGTMTGLVAVRIAAHTQGTNNTYVLMGTTAIPVGQFGIYSTTANGSSLLGHLIVGVNSATSASIVIQASKTLADVAATAVGVDGQVTFTFPGGANAQTLHGVRGLLNVTQTGGNATATVSSALRGLATANGTTNTVTGLAGVDVLVQNTATGILTNGYGVHVASAINSGGGTFTNNYGILVEDQTIGATLNYAFFSKVGVISVLGSATIASAAGATWRGIEFRAATATISGGTNITTAAGFNYIDIARPTLLAGTALTITNSATLYIANSPLGGGAGPATITNAYAIWVDAGVSRFDGNIVAQGLVTTYNNVATEGYGLPAIVDLVALTAQGANIATTNCSGADVAGVYRVSAYLQDTTADAAAGTVTLTFTWTDDVGSTTSALTQALITTGRQSSVFFVRLASGNLTYATTHTGIFGSSLYAVHFTVERLN